MDPGAWSWSPEALVPVAARRVVPARRAPGGERLAGALRSSRAARCSSLALVSPLDTVARDYLVWGHLLQNVVLAEWAPLLLVLGLPPGACGKARAPDASSVR